MYFRYATVTEFIESIMQLNKEGGINDVMCKNYVSFYLKELFNFGITLGVYTNVFKTAQITHMHKKGSVPAMSIYRPVSVLSNISTVLKIYLSNV